MESLVVTGVPAIGAVVAAGVSGWFAFKSRGAQASAERALELERRLTMSRAEVYEPLIEMLRAAFDSTGTAEPRTPGERREHDRRTQESIVKLSQFAAWVQVYGSDEVVRVFHRWMQAANSEPPTQIVVRIYAELLRAIRHDLGDPESDLRLAELIGVRISDVYESGIAEILDLPEEEFYRRFDWMRPWLRAASPKSDGVGEGR